MASASTLPPITKDMTVRDIVALSPVAADIMGEYGLHCYSCSVGGMETLEEGCRMHGFDPETVDALLIDINDARDKEPRRPQMLTITKEGALGIGEIIRAEKKEGQVLVVGLDEVGGFCMEIREAADKGDLLFRNAEVPDIRIYASPITLSRIGGATIDFRDGRFKLDLPEEGECCGGSGGGCGCHGTKK